MLNNKYFRKLTSFIALSTVLIVPLQVQAQIYQDYVYINPDQEDMEYYLDEEQYPVEKSNGFLWFLGAAAVGVGAGVGITASNNSRGKHHHKKIVAKPINPTNSIASASLQATNHFVGASSAQTQQMAKPANTTTLSDTKSTTNSNPISVPTDPIVKEPSPIVKEPSKVANTGHSLIFEFTLNVATTLGGGMIAYVQAPDGKIFNAAPFSLLSLNRTIIVTDPIYGNYSYGVMVNPSLLSIAANLNVSISSDIPGRGLSQSLPLSLGVVTSQTQAHQEFNYDPSSLR